MSLDKVVLHSWKTSPHKVIKTSPVSRRIVPRVPGGSGDVETVVVERRSNPWVIVLVAVSVIALAGGLMFLLST